MKTTALHNRHRALNAKMTDFHGWEMPLYYTSILEEHKAVRQALGIFDISHMGQVLVTGDGALAMLNRLLVSDISQVAEGRACYTLMLNEQGGILDDLIVYRIGSDDYLVIINCANRQSDFDWLQAHRHPQATVTSISEGRSMLAIQGPLAARVLENLLDARVSSLGRFGIAPIRTMGPESCIARTGYTGSDGFELFVSDYHAQRLWDAILEVATARSGGAIGLGARDTLRVEAALRLYGTDMDTTTSPLEAGLGWTVAMNKTEFIGKPALVQQKQRGLVRQFVGFELTQGPIPRSGCELKADGRKIGQVTSGTFSPTMNKPLGMGYVEPDFAKPGTTLTLTVRAQTYPATVVKLPFWKAQSLPVSPASGVSSGYRSAEASDAGVPSSCCPPAIE